MRGIYSLLALLALAQAGAVEAAPCPSLPAGVSMGAAAIRLDIPDRNAPIRARIAGTLEAAPGVADAQLRKIARSDLCRAAIGDADISGRDICPAFGSGFGESDRLRREGSRIAFDIGTRLQRADLLFNLHARPAAERCAPSAVFTIRTVGGLEFAAAPLLADQLTGRAMTWTERAWGPQSTIDLSIALRDRGQEEADAGDAPGPAMSPPRSWTSYAGGDVLAGLRDFFGALLYILVVVSGFMLFGGGLIYSRAKPPLATLTRALSATISLYAAASWVRVARAASGLINNGSFDNRGLWWAEAYHSLAAGIGYPSALVVVAALLVAPLTVIFVLCRLVAGPTRPAATLLRHGFRLGIHGAAVGSVIALLFLAAMAAAALLLPQDMPFEPLALFVSLGVAIWAVAPFADDRGFSRRVGALLAVAITLLFLYPQPVITGSAGPPTAVENALVWFPYLSGYFVPSAMLLTVALLASLKIARSVHSGDEEHEADRALLFLFGLAVTFRSLVDLSSALLFLLVVAVGERLLFPRRDPSAATAKARRRHAPPAAASGVLDPSLRLAVAVAAVAIIVFWLQYSGRLVGEGAPSGLLLPAMLTYAAAVPAAIGALLLSHSYDRLPTQVAAIKALAITLFAFAAMMATRLDAVLAERSVLPAIIDLLGIFTALVGMAILLYDWPRAQHELQGDTLKQKLAGSGFGWLVTILSSASLATVSAISPVFFKELGNSFQVMVKQIQHKSDTPPPTAAPAGRDGD